MLRLSQTSIVLKRSKTGLFLLSENGGGMSNTGRSRIVCGPRGERLKAVYIPKRGALSNKDHAWVNVTREADDKQCYIIEADHHRGDFHIIVKRIVSLHERLMPKTEIPCDVESHDASLTSASVMWANTVVICEYSDGEWDHYPYGYLTPAIEAAKGKAMDYHCRSPWYVITPEDAGQPDKTITALYVANTKEITCQTTKG